MRNPSRVYTLTLEQDPLRLEVVFPVTLLDQVSEMLGRHEKFTNPELSEGTCGYGSCSGVRHQDCDIVLYFPFNHSFVNASVETLSAVLGSLNFILSGVRLNEGGVSNREQVMEVELGSTRNQFCPFYAGGHVDPPLGRWLAKQATLLVNEPPHYRVTLSWVEAQMRQVWELVSSEPVKQYGNYCSATVLNDGRFILDTFGDACDVAVYPDGLGSFGTIDQGMVDIGCHNIDSPAQVLTLAAGLAAMQKCVLEEEDEL